MFKSYGASGPEKKKTHDAEEPKESNFDSVDMDPAVWMGVERGWPMATPLWDDREVGAPGLRKRNPDRSGPVPQPLLIPMVRSSWQPLGWRFGLKPLLG